LAFILRVIGAFFVGLGLLLLALFNFLFPAKDDD
jgi:hypothetical protein